MKYVKNVANPWLLKPAGLANFLPAPVFPNAKIQNAFPKIRWESNARRAKMATSFSEDQNAAKYSTDAALTQNAISRFGIAPREKHVPRAGRS